MTMQLRAHRLLIALFMQAVACYRKEQNILFASMTAISQESLIFKSELFDSFVGV